MLRFHQRKAVNIDQFCPNGQTSVQRGCLPVEQEGKLNLYKRCYFHMSLMHACIVPLWNKKTLKDIGSFFLTEQQ